MPDENVVKVERTRVAAPPPSRKCYTTQQQKATAFQSVKQSAQSQQTLAHTVVCFGLPEKRPQLKLFILVKSGPRREYLKLARNWQETGKVQSSHLILKAESAAQRPKKKLMFGKLPFQKRHLVGEAHKKCSRNPP